MEDTYTQYLLKAFKKTCADKLYDCVIIDCNNTRLQYLGDFYFIAQANFFTVSVKFNTFESQNYSLTKKYVNILAIHLRAAFGRRQMFEK